MPYALREHTADVAVEATAERLDAVFAATADGLAAAQCADPPERGDRYAVAVGAESRDALLLDYLNHLLYRRDVDGVLPVANHTSVREPGDESAGGTRTGAGTHGESAGHDGSSSPGVGDDASGPPSVARDDVSGRRSVDGDDASETQSLADDWTLTGSFRGVPLAAVEATEVKAATYAEFDLSRTDEGWRAYVVLDV